MQSPFSRLSVKRYFNDWSAVLGEKIQENFEALHQSNSVK